MCTCPTPPRCPRKCIIVPWGNTELHVKLVFFYSANPTQTVCIINDVCVVLIVTMLTCSISHHPQCSHHACLITQQCDIITTVKRCMACSLTQSMWIVYHKDVIHSLKNCLDPTHQSQIFNLILLIKIISEIRVPLALATLQYNCLNHLTRSHRL